MSKFYQHDQSVQTQFNAENVYHIQLVGQFLDYAKLANLFNSGSSLEPKSIEEVFNKIYSEDNNGNLANSVAFAGEILAQIHLSKPAINPPAPKRGFFRSKKIPTVSPSQENPFAVFPIKTILQNKLPSLIYEKLNKSDYWETFSQATYAHLPYPHKDSNFRRLILISTAELMKQRLNSNIEYSLISGINIKPIFVERHINEYAKQSSRNLDYYPPINFDEFSNEQMRIFFTGVVIDLIRISSLAREDTEFWKKIIGYVRPKSDSGSV